MNPKGACLKYKDTKRIVINAKLKKSGLLNLKFLLNKKAKKDAEKPKILKLKYELPKT